MVGRRLLSASTLLMVLMTNVSGALAPIDGGASRDIESLTDQVASAAAPGSSTTSVARTVVTTLTPTVDTWINETPGSTGDNHEGEQFLWVGEDEFTFPFYALLRFDLSSIPSNANVTDATLELFHEGSQSSSQKSTICVYRVGSAWDGTVTGDTAPTLDKVCQASAAVQTAVGAETWSDLSSLVSEWVSGARTNHGLALKQSSSGMHYKAFQSSEGNVPPTLEITYTVPPSSVAPQLRFGKPRYDLDECMSAEMYEPAFNVNPNESESVEVLVYSHLTGDVEKTQLTEDGTDSATFVSGGCTELDSGPPDEGDGLLQSQPGDFIAIAALRDQEVVRLGMGTVAGGKSSGQFDVKVDPSIQPTELASTPGMAGEPDFTDSVWGPFHADISPGPGEEPLLECGSVTRREYAPRMVSPRNVAVDLSGQVTIRVTPEDNRLAARPVNGIGETLHLYDGDGLSIDGLGSWPLPTLQQVVRCPQSEEDLSELIFSFGERDDVRDLLDSGNGQGYKVEVDYTISAHRGLPPGGLDPSPGGELGCGGGSIPGPFGPIPAPAFPWCPDGGLVDVPFPFDPGCIACGDEGEYFFVEAPNEAWTLSAQFETPNTMAFDLLDTNLQVIASAQPLIARQAAGSAAANVLDLTADLEPGRLYLLKVSGEEGSTYSIKHNVPPMAGMWQVFLPSVLRR